MKTEITKEEFEAYESVRVSGVTNMFMTNVVSELSGLDRATIISIIKGYTELAEKYKSMEVKL